MLPTFSLCFAFTGINFRGMLHHVYYVAYDENMCGPIRTRKCSSTNWLINQMLVFERGNVLDKSSESLSSVLCNSKSKSETSWSNKSNFTDAKVGLQEIKSKCPDKLKMGHWNINSISSTFDALSLIVKNNLDILMISESKLDDLFPTAQCLLHGFNAPYRLDRNSKFGGILLYIK